jgi:ribosome-associated protein
MIPITPQLGLDEKELQFDFIRSSGPGGQNVNKVSTAVQLRFNLRGSNSLPADLRDRAALLAGSRLTSEGVLIISARRFRTQEANRKDAVNRLVSLLCKAAAAPKKRRKSKPTLASTRNRLVSKLHTRSIKRLRRNKHSIED